MYNTQLLEIFECGKQLDRKSADKSVIEALIVVHLYKLV